MAQTPLKKKASTTTKKRYVLSSYLLLYAYSYCLTYGVYPALLERKKKIYPRHSTWKEKESNQRLMN